MQKNIDHEKTKVYKIDVIAQGITMAPMYHLLYLYT